MSISPSNRPQTKTEKTQKIPRKKLRTKQGTAFDTALFMRHATSFFFLACFRLKYRCESNEMLHHRRLVVRVITPKSASSKYCILRDFPVNEKLVNLRLVHRRYLSQNADDTKSVLINVESGIPTSKTYAALCDLRFYAILSDLQW